MITRQHCKSPLNAFKYINYSLCFLFWFFFPLGPHSWINTSPLSLPSSRLFGNDFCPLSSWDLLSTFSCPVLDLWFLDTVYSSLHCFGSTSVFEVWKIKKCLFYPPTWLLAWMYNSRFRDISFRIVKWLLHHLLVPTVGVEKSDVISFFSSSIFLTSSLSSSGLKRCALI